MMLEWEINGRRFHIREAQTGSDYEAVEEIQREAWGFADIDIVPGDMLVASQHAGGLLLCAFEGEWMIGFAYAFPALEAGKLSFHSHMLAVRSEVRNLQAGFYLKFAQRQRALALGVHEITWTFDPLQSLNAHLNFAKLGVTSHRYFVNFYGEATSSPLHQGFGTDRLWVNWHLSSERVTGCVERLKAKAEGGGAGAPSEPAFTLEEDDAVLVRGEGGRPRLADSLPAGLSRSPCFIEIPYQINALKEGEPELGRAWREATRAAFLAAVEAGFTVEDFGRVDLGESRRWLYRLTR